MRGSFRSRGLSAFSVSFPSSKSSCHLIWIGITTGGFIRFPIPMNYIKSIHLSAFSLVDMIKIDKELWLEGMKSSSSRRWYELLF